MAEKVTWWKEPPYPLDILFCCFPYDEKDLPAPEPHYCLVISRRVHKGEWWVAVIFGTSKHTREQDLLPGQFAIRSGIAEEAAYLRRAGLTKTTKFDCFRMRWLPLQQLVVLL